MPYNLDALGWLQFERLCDHALELACGVDRGLWSGNADEGRVAVLEDVLRLSLGLGELPEPVAVVAVWARTPDESWAIADAVVGAQGLATDAVLVTNLAADSG